MGKLLLIANIGCNFDMKLLLLTYFVFLLSLKSYACSCSSNEQSPSAISFFQYKHVVKAIVKSIKSGEAGNTISFQILIDYKSSVKDFITMSTGIGNGDCGLQTDIGEEWLMLINDTTSVNICDQVFHLNGKDVKDARLKYALESFNSSRSLTDGFHKIEENDTITYEGRIKQLLAEGKWKCYKNHNNETFVSSEMSFSSGNLIDTIFNFDKSGKVLEKLMIKESGLIKIEDE